MTRTLHVDVQNPTHAFLLVLALTIIGRLDPTLLAAFTTATQFVNPNGRP